MYARENTPRHEKGSREMASIHDGWTPQPQEETMDERYTERFREGDTDAWWMLSDGQKWNLYSEMEAKSQAAEDEAAKWKSYRLCASHYPAPDALDYGHDKCVLCLMNARDNLREEVERLQAELKDARMKTWHE